MTGQKTVISGKTAWCLGDLEVEGGCKRKSQVRRVKEGEGGG